MTYESESDDEAVQGVQGVQGLVPPTIRPTSATKRVGVRCPVTLLTRYDPYTAA